MTPTEQDKELRGKIESTILTWSSSVTGQNREKLAPEAEELVEAFAVLFTADMKRAALEARIDTATDILYGFSRTYKQEVTDSAGNVYANDSHGYISKYEVQELVEKLKQELEKL